VKRPSVRPSLSCDLLLENYGKQSVNGYDASWTYQLLLREVTSQVHYKTPKSIKYCHVGGYDAVMMVIRFIFRGGCLVFKPNIFLCRFF
jgi:hypothetical protein